MNHHDAIVIGAGQSGLAAAAALQAAGLQPVVLEAGHEPVGSWPRYYDSLRLFSPARYSAIPGHPFPGDPERYPHRDEVIDYLRRYAAGLDLDIQLHQRVRHVQQTAETEAGFAARTDTQTLHSPIVIAATGGFGNPHLTQLPGADSFTGAVLHASSYRRPEPFTGQRIIVVGAGNSAVQIAVELAEHAEVTLATRAPITYAPYRLLGRDIHFWSTTLGIDHLPIGHLLTTPPRVPVIDTGGYRTAIGTGKVARTPMFSRLDEDTVIWPDRSPERVDTIILATGYRPDLGYLASLGALDHTGRPRHRRGLSCTHPGLAYVGLEWQRSLASATLRGATRDAHHTVNHLTRTADKRTSRCCAALRR